MAKNQKKYTPEFKQQLVDLYNTGNYSFPQLSSEYGVAKSTILGWVRNLSPIQVSETETISMKDYKTLQKKMRELEIENEILKRSKRLALEAVKNACLNVTDTNGIILHSDLGSQYTSELFGEYMRCNGFVHSFSRKGNPYDNACIESFHSVMKKEEIYLHTCQDFEECRKALFEYIESWYNRRRIHSALGYKTPQQVEDEAIQAA